MASAMPHALAIPMKPVEERIGASVFAGLAKQL